MKEKIYTIPVNDAYRSTSACPLCELAAQVEDSSLSYYLGASLMEPDVRKTTNTIGFCGHHLSRMYAAEINRLGMGLMLHTHLLDIKKDVGELLSTAAPASGSFLKGRDRDYRKNLESLADKIEDRIASCIVCDKISYTMERYLDVLLWLFFEDPEFRKMFAAKTNHCLHHTAFLLRGAGRLLSQTQANEFVGVLAGRQNLGLDEMIKDMEGFTLKFDYRNKDMPWGNSKTAIPRAISLLAGKRGSENGS